MASITNAAALEMLKRNVIFGLLGEGPLRKLLAGAELESFEEGERIITEGDISETLFLVLDGGVTVMVNKEQREVFICAIGAGDSFGEAGIFMKIRRTANVTAAMPTTVLCIERRRLMRFVHEDPSIGVKLLLLLIYNLLRKLRGANQELAYERKSDVNQDDIDAIMADL